MLLVSPGGTQVVQVLRDSLAHFVSVLFIYQTLFFMCRESGVGIGHLVLSVDVKNRAGSHHLHQRLLGQRRPMRDFYFCGEIASS